MNSKVSILLKVLFLLSMAYFFHACAHRVAPAGGPIDESPPSVIGSSPQNKTVSYDRNRIVIEFDKYIQLSDPMNQIMISPPLGYTPNIEARRKELRIELKRDSLLDNTTYTINFGEAIRDNREGNVLHNYSFVFSTGDYIDSFFVSGYVFDAFTNKPLEGMRVLAHNNLSDSAVLKKRPMYFARTNAEGFFRINNMIADTFNFFALKDESGDYVYKAGEKFAFLDSSFILTDSLETPPFYAFVHDWRNPRVNDAAILAYGKAAFVFNRQVQSIDIEPLFNFKFQNGKKAFTFQSFSEKRDSVYFWFEPTDMKADSHYFILTLNDSIKDTVEARLVPSLRRLQTEIKPDSVFNFYPNIRRGAALELDKNLILHFKTPLITYDLQKIEIIKDSTDKIKPTVNLLDTKAANQAKLNFKTDPDSFYELLILPGAFTDMFNATNLDSFYLNFYTRDLTAYGLIELNYKLTDESAYPSVIQLLRMDKVERDTQVTESKKVRFELLIPGSYEVRAIRDINEDGKWTSGNYFLRRQPEPVYYLPERINLRANWDIEDILLEVPPKTE